MQRPAAGFVEDSDDDYELFSRVFARRWELQRWATGEDATAALFDGSVLADLEVLLVDHDLPGINGIAVIEQVLGAAPERAPLICMLSGTGRPSIVDSALAAGADAFFEKPRTLAGLRQLVTDIAELADAR